MMVPDTRNSLIIRLPDSGDTQAWEQFAQLYEPLVFRFARSRGIQDADAREITQDVLLLVAQAVQRWHPDRNKGRFRDWLFRIARNQMIKYMTRRKHRPWAVGGSGFGKLLENHPGASEEDTREWDQTYEQEMFQWASEQVRLAVTPKTWKAFWATCVEGRPVAEVANELGLSQGAVYIARSRVIGRFQAFLKNQEPGETPENRSDW